MINYKQEQEKQSVIKHIMSSLSKKDIPTTLFVLTTIISMMLLLANNFHLLSDQNHTMENVNDARKLLMEEASPSTTQLPPPPPPPTQPVYFAQRQRYYERQKQNQPHGSEPQKKAQYDDSSHPMASIPHWPDAAKSRVYDSLENEILSFIEEFKSSWQDASFEHRYQFYKVSNKVKLARDNFDISFKEYGELHRLMRENTHEERTQIEDEDIFSIYEHYKERLQHYPPPEPLSHEEVCEKLKTPRAQHIAHQIIVQYWKIRVAENLPCDSRSCFNRSLLQRHPWSPWTKHKPGKRTRQEAQQILEIFETALRREMHVLAASDNLVLSSYYPRLDLPFSADAAQANPDAAVSSARRLLSTKYQDSGQSIIKPHKLFIILSFILGVMQIF